MKKKIRKLTPKEIQVLKDQFSTLKFVNDFDLVYESQVPNSGIILLNGQITLLKKKKAQGSVIPGTLLGVNQLCNNEPVKMGIRVMGNSELIILHKSEILEALNDKDSELYAIIKEIAEKA